MSRQPFYPTRLSPTPAILERQDPVVYSDGPLPAELTEEQVQFYEQNGYLAIEGLFSPEELKVFNQELNLLTSDEKIREDERTIIERDSNLIRSFFQIHHLSPLFDQLSRDKRILDIVHYLLGSEVYIHQSRINLKLPFLGRGFNWHSDFETWQIEDGMPRMRALSVSISLTDNYEFNGPLIVVPGSHKKFVSCVGEGKNPEKNYKQSLKKQVLGVPDPASVTQLVEEGGLVALKGKAGSVVFFDCNTLHTSSNNVSPYPRCNVFLVYNSVQNTLQEPFLGSTPRPLFAAERENVAPLVPVEPEYTAIS